MFTVITVQKPGKPKMKRLVPFKKFPKSAAIAAAAAAVTASGSKSPKAALRSVVTTTPPTRHPKPQTAVPPAIAAKPVQVVRVKVREEGFGKLPEHGFVRLPTILEVYPISRAGWWAGVKDGTLPAGVLLSARVRAWAVEDIRQLIAQAKQAA